jgi:hypothetical protein
VVGLPGAELSPDGKTRDWGNGEYQREGTGTHRVRRVPDRDANEPLVKVFGWYDNEWGYSCRTAAEIVIASMSDNCDPVRRRFISRLPG